MHEVGSFSQSFVCALAVPSLGCSLIFPGDEYRGGDPTLEDVCSSEQVLRCFGFESQEQVDALHVLETCVNHPLEACHGTVDTDIKHSGEGSLRFVIPSARLVGEGNDDVGGFGLNFTPDSRNEPPDGPYTIAINTGESVYVSWAQRVDAQMLDTTYGSYGWNAATIGPGDREGVGAPYFSAMALSAGVGPSYQLPQLWGTLYDVGAQSCRSTDVTSVDTMDRLLLQNAVGCSYDLSDEGCFFYVPDTWQRFELGLHFAGFEAALSRVELWAAREGEAPVKLIDLEVRICEPPPEDAPFNANYGKVWLSPRMDYRAAVARDGFVWYDDLVISRAPVMQ